MDSTRQARLYAEEALQAEQTKLEHGKSTSFVVLQLQNNLTAARSAEIRALADYNIALEQLAFDDGTTTFASATETERSSRLARGAGRAVDLLTSTHTSTLRPGRAE